MRTISFQLVINLSIIVTLNKIYSNYDSTDVFIKKFRVLPARIIRSINTSRLSR